MPALVINLVALSGKFPTTELTSKRLLPSMRAEVMPQGGTLGKAAIATFDCALVHCGRS